ncbi:MULTISPECIES: hypothetical protein [Streptomyces]|uniref:hypothetical protein n=1 Tax=Streptomyces sp. NBC_00826 TaxID=2975845 RepID=UPI003525D209
MRSTSHLFGNTVKPLVSWLQRFLSTFSQISPHFRPRRHRMTATGYRTEMRHRFGTRNEITGTAAMPTEA